MTAGVVHVSSQIELTVSTWRLMTELHLHMTLPDKQEGVHIIWPTDDTTINVCTHHSLMALTSANKHGKQEGGI